MKIYIFKRKAAQEDKNRPNKNKQQQNKQTNSQKKKKKIKLNEKLTHLLWKIKYDL